MFRAQKIEISTNFKGFILLKIALYTHVQMYMYIFVYMQLCKLALIFRFRGILISLDTTH